MESAELLRSEVEEDEVDVVGETGADDLVPTTFVPTIPIALLFLAFSLSLLLICTPSRTRRR